MFSKLPRNDLIAISLAVAVVLCWSTVATGFKLGLQYMSVPQLLFASTLISFIFLAVVACFTGVKKLTWKTVGLGAVLGLINPFLYYLVLFAAYDRLPAQIAQPLNYTHAIVTALIAIPLLKQRPTPRIWLGLIVGYLGVFVLVTQGSFTKFSFDHLGVALALGSALIWGAYWVMTVRYSEDAVTLLLIAFATATPCAAVFCLMFDSFPEFNLVNLGFAVWLGVAEMGLAFLLWQRALKTATQVSLITPIAYFSPALSLFFIRYVLGEQVPLVTVLGLGILMVGIVIIYLRKEQRTT